MPGSGTRNFLDPEGYQAGLRAAAIEAVVTSHGEFNSRLTWAELQELQLLHCEEDFARIAFLSLAHRFVYVSFPTAFGGSTLWAGATLTAEDIFLHARGEQLHQSTSGRFAWSLIVIDALRLDSYSSALSGYQSPLPPAGKVLRPAQRDAARLKRLHAQVCRLAEAKPKMLTRLEVVRAIEQDLMQVLVACLSARGIEPEAARQHRAAIMAKFEEVIARHLDVPLRISELSGLIGVSERVLRSCCAEFIGIGPSRYLLLRRLKWARWALQNASAGVAAVARGCGLGDLQRFVRLYEATFGESPTATLRQAREESFTTR
jgi:AraC-like DNA-binding protein